MLFLRFSSNVTPRIFFVTALLPIATSWLRLYCHGMIQHPHRGGAAADTRHAAAAASAPPVIAGLPTGAPRSASPAHGNAAPAPAPRSRRSLPSRSRMHHTGRADAERMLLTVKRDAGLAHRFELLEQIVEPRHRLRRAPLDSSCRSAARPRPRRAAPDRPCRWRCSRAGKASPTADTARSRCGPMTWSTKMR